MISVFGLVENSIVVAGIVWTSLVVKDIYFSEILVFIGLGSGRRAEVAVFIDEITTKIL